MEKLIKKHYHEQQEYILIQQKLAEWDHGLVDCEQLERFCKKHERKKEIKRGIKKMKAWFKKNYHNIFMVTISILFLSITIAIYHEPKTNNDWLAPKTKTMKFIRISNGIDTVLVPEYSMPRFRHNYADNGSLQSMYVRFNYKYENIQVTEVLELIDNEAGSMEEWKESIEACFPVGGSNDI